MKEISKKSQEFIRHFGEMGSRWGINRTVGQIYALLYLSKNPLDAATISELLGFSRSNVGASIKELEEMNIIKTSYIEGLRTEHYSALDDIFDIVKNLVEYRKNQEIDPTLLVLNDLLSDINNKQARKHEIKKMKEMQKTIDLFDKWHNEMKDVDSEKLLKLFKLGKNILKIFDFFKKKDS